MTIARVAAAVALTAGVGLSFTPAAAATTHHPLVYSSCVKPTYRPHSYVLTCADGYTRIQRAHYSAWTGNSAAGHGRYVYNTCTPSCVAGTIKHHPVTFRLSRVRRVKGARLFTRITVFYAGLSETFTLPTAKS
jgi:hypothetical protein